MCFRATMAKWQKVNDFAKSLVVVAVVNCKHPKKIAEETENRNLYNTVVHTHTHTCRRHNLKTHQRHVITNAGIYNFIVSLRNCGCQHHHQRLRQRLRYSVALEKQSKARKKKIRKNKEKNKRNETAAKMVDIRIHTLNRFTANSEFSCTRSGTSQHTFAVHIITNESLSR